MQAVQQGNREACMQLLQLFAGYSSLLVSAEHIVQCECALLAGQPLGAFSAVIRKYR